MSVQKETYADGLAQIHMIEGMVRLDFMRLQPGQDGKAPIPQPTERVIMNPQAFLRTFQAMQQMLDKFVEAGILKKGDAPTSIN